MVSQLIECPREEVRREAFPLEVADDVVGGDIAFVETEGGEVAGCRRRWRESARSDMFPFNFPNRHALNIAAGGKVLPPRAGLPNVNNLKFFDEWSKDLLKGRRKTPRPRRDFQPRQSRQKSFARNVKPPGIKIIPIDCCNRHVLPPVPVTSSCAII